MMRLLLLCLLLPTTAGYSIKDGDELNGSGDDPDDEDLLATPEHNVAGDLGKTTGDGQESDQITLIIIVVAVVAVALSIVAIIAIILVRRHRNKQQQGIYSVPIDQDKKDAV
ncbi:unnamed protein product [Knipowitschia caucasica]